MTKYKALFLDIDGTIVKPDETIEDSTKEAIAKVQQQGIHVFLATGRPLHEIQHITEQLQIDSLIGYNGALAIMDNQTIVNEPMDSSLVNHYIKTAKKLGNEMVLYTDKLNIYTNIKAPVVKEFIKQFHLKQNEQLHTQTLDNILGISIIDVTDQEIQQYQTNETIYFSKVNVESIPSSYDVIRETVNKGISIKKLLEILGIPKESAIAFGDGMNDKGMLSNVGESFAMGNAHPDLIPYAKHQTTSVTESGIFNGLKSLGLL
ncbi:HAD family hydrolase [Bacillaceae bacterium S4-13-58]